MIFRLKQLGSRFYSIKNLSERVFIETFVNIKKRLNLMIQALFINFKMYPGWGYNHHLINLNINILQYTQKIWSRFSPALTFNSLPFKYTQILLILNHFCSHYNSNS